MKKCPDGSRIVAVSDRRFGTTREHLDNLGETDGGLAKVIQVLDKNGWGPLWVRDRPERGIESLFQIPPEGRSAWGRALYPMADMLDDGYVVPARGLGGAIRRLLAEIPSDPDHRTAHKDLDSVARIVDGTLLFPRVEILHRLLCGARGTRGVQVVENGPSSNPTLSILLARMGSRVVVKEPGGLRTHREFIERAGGAELLQRLEYRSTPKGVAQQDPSHVVYWANPGNEISGVPRGDELAYFSRDVAPGGFLVVQSDIRPRLSFPSNGWDPVYRGVLLPGTLLPTMFEGMNFLEIYQRRTRLRSHR